MTLVLLAMLAANAAFWWGSRAVYARWAGVPPAPSPATATIMTLGDTQLAYRTGALTLQQLGNGGRQFTPLREYDYDMLGRWFWLLHGLDPASEHVPYSAAYYFGALHDPEKIAVVVDYLSVIGQNPAGEKWRWLVEAAFLARHRMEDLDRALDIAYALARMEPLDKPLPPWAREMPALILEARGENEAARRIMESILLTERNLPPQEVNFLKSYLVERLGVPKEEVDALAPAHVP